MKITKRQIDTALRKASFRPGELGPMRVVCEVGDIAYYMKRAQECLILASESPTREQTAMYLNTALKLTALAVVHNENP